DYYCYSTDISGNHSLF
nr:immunoglobulin light chain junction region [Macaca mulatta]MOW02869.1 immunoglobulin light chain junction region [Macaca mulatta]MOW57235.1 immunoglobulin light chain junction region [Macaca mulatta]MOW57623.1 immunoglobulin light chain junction region [Macaca mulatta]MOW57795.1 immunoglobulin light chain junction region [Macaca mulatta]